MLYVSPSSQFDCKALAASGPDLVEGSESHDKRGDRKQASFQITVANRDYHYLSQSEIASDKRISQQLFPLSMPPRKPDLLTNPSPSVLWDQQRLRYQGFGVLETAMGGAKS